MKKQIYLLLLVSLFSAQSAFARDFAYKEIFERKLERLDRSAGIRRAGRVVLFTIGGITGMGVIFAGIGAGALTLTGVAFYGGIFGIPSGVSLGLETDSPRELQFRSAYDAQTMMHRSHADLLREAEVKRDEAIKLALAKFDADITHPDYLEDLVTKTNHERLRAGLPWLTPAEVAAVTRQNIKATILNGKLEVTNVISESLYRLKAKGWVAEEMSYDEFRGRLFSDESVFCPEKKALPLKSVLRNVFRP